MKKIILIGSIFLIIGLFIYNDYRFQKYTILFNALDTDIAIEFYTNDKQLAQKTIVEIQNIYQKYHQLTNRDQAYDSIINLYTIRHNFLKESFLPISKELYQLLEYGAHLYNETKGVIDISMGNVTNLWNTYLEAKIGIPSKEEIALAHNQKINDIVLEKNTIQNNHVNIDLDGIKVGYVTDMICNYLKQQNITNYYINAGNVMVMGNSYYKNNYTIALPSPDSKTDILMILKLKKKAIVTKNILQKQFFYQNHFYHNHIDSFTGYPSNTIKSVTVIGKTAKEAEKIANILFSMPVQEGQNYIKNVTDIEVIWVTNEDQIIQTKGIQNLQ